MKRLFKFLLGLAIGAGVAVLLAPKSGRELREQLMGGATSRLLPPGEDQYAPPADEPSWRASSAPSWSAPAATAVAEPPVVEEIVVEEAADPGGPTEEIA